jgi:hypothetical protein
VFFKSKNGDFVIANSNRKLYYKIKNKYLKLEEYSLQIQH